MSSKAELRDKHRTVRLAMDSREVDRLSIDICRRLYMDFEWGKLRKICSYEPIAELKEVDVIPLLETVKYKYPASRIKLIGMSPKSKVPKAKFDLIIVPVLAFDKANYRLGWGGGWYDRFLAQQPQAVKIGVSFKNGLADGDLPREPHDIPLDKIFTEI